MRRLPFALACLLVAADARAQSMRQRFPVSAPTAWVTGGVGSQDGWTVVDGKTGSQWQFGNSTQYAASLEKSVSNGISLGLRGTTATVPMTYSGLGGTSDADVKVSQAFATLHAASPGQFHTVLEFSAGATIYSNFKTRGAGTTLPPDSPDSDFSYAYGYGAGYALSSTFALDVVRESNSSVHQSVGLAAGTDTKSRWNVTRVVVRVGF